MERGATSSGDVSRLRAEDWPFSFAFAFAFAGQMMNRLFRFLGKTTDIDASVDRF
jgi:hypothetical protein